MAINLVFILRSANIPFAFMLSLENCPLKKYFTKLKEINNKIFALITLYAVIVVFE